MAKTQWPEHAVTNGRSIIVMEDLLRLISAPIPNNFQGERRPFLQMRNTASKEVK